jgi:hypothetical protein
MNTRTLSLLAAAAVCLAGCDRAPSEPVVERVPEAPLSADSRFELTDQSVEKAIALLLVVENPITKNPARPFGGHRTKAVSLLERARAEIAAAVEYADDPKNAP